MISYLLEVSLYWMLGYAVYLALFGRWTLFQWNRGYLLAVLVGGAMLPLIPFSPGSEALGANAYLPEVWVTLSGEIQYLNEAVSNGSSTPWFQAMAWIYIAGCTLFIARTAYSLWSIRNLFQKGVPSEEDDYTLVRTAEHHPPFAFGRWIFINHQFDLKSNVHRIILNHEKAHVRAGHTLDVLMTEIMGWIFWFHPLVYLYRYALRLNHEYMADAEVLKNHSKISYGRAFLEFHRYQPEWHLTRSFHFSKLKKRFIMMNTSATQRQKRWSYFAVIPLFLFAFVLIGPDDLQAHWTSEQEVPADDLKQDTIPGEKVYKQVEYMPLFPACESVEDAEEKRQCANQKMLEFIYENIEYPGEAQAEKIEGMVVLTFIIGTDGSVRDIEVVRNPHDALSEAAVRAVDRMRKENIRWTPGKRANGEKVPVQFTLPVRFQVPKDDDKSSKSSMGSLIENISPNPSDGKIKVLLKGKGAPAELIIKDPRGHIVRREKIRSLAPKQSLEFSFDSQGTYWLQVRQGDESNATKFVIN